MTPFAAQGKRSGGALGAILFSALSAELDFPRLKPIYEFTSFRWTEVQLPPAEAGGSHPTATDKRSSGKRSASLAPARRPRYESRGANKEQGKTKAAALKGGATRALRTADPSSAAASVGMTVWEAAAEKL